MRLSFMTFVALWHLLHYDVCRIMTFVALWRLSHYCMMFVGLLRLSHYDICRLWRLSNYDVCCIMTFVALLYDVCKLITFVTLWRLSLMTFVALWCLSHYDICRQLWRLSLIGFVAVSQKLVITFRKVLVDYNLRFHNYSHFAWKGELPRSARHAKGLQTTTPTADWRPEAVSTMTNSFKRVQQNEDHGYIS